MIRFAEINDLKRITEIYNYEIKNGVATFDEVEKTIDERKKWFDMHDRENNPIFVYTINNEVLGYVSLSKYRMHEAYSRTAELSLYVDVSSRGKKIASKLMAYVIDYAKTKTNLHTIISVITTGNEKSTHLHVKYNFSYSGTLKEVGFKFNNYLSVDNYILIINR